VLFTFGIRTPRDSAFYFWNTDTSVGNLNRRWPESLFQTPTPLLFQNFWILVRLFFKFENPTPVQTPAAIINPTIIYPRFYLRNDRTDSCYCRNGKVTPGLFFPKFLTPDPGPIEKRRILPESTSAIRLRYYLWLEQAAVLPTLQRWGDIDFLTPGPYPIIFLNIHIQSLSENLLNLKSDIHLYPNATLVNTKQTGSGYRSSRGPSFLKTYSSITCNKTLIHDKCAVGWTVLGRNLINLNPTLNKPKPHIWLQKVGNFKKVNKNRYHEKCKPLQPKQMVPDYGKRRHVYLTTMTVLLMWQTQQFILTVSPPVDLYPLPNKNTLSFCVQIHKNNITCCALSIVKTEN